MSVHCKPVKLDTIDTDYVDDVITIGSRPDELGGGIEPISSIKRTIVQYDLPHMAPDDELNFWWPGSYP